jgi:hypothetical protein
MADPIKVDFKRRRDRPATKPTAQKPPPSRHPPARPGHEPMINWRAAPKALVIIAVVFALMAALRWFTHG